MRINEQLLKNIYNFDSKFKNKEYIENKTLTFKGYLVNLNEYEEYNKNKYSGMNNIGKKLHQIRFKTASYLINMILNGNKYIIIEPEIWNKILPINKEIDSPVYYFKNISHIIIKFEDGISLYFSNFNKNNILDINSYYKIENKNYISNYNEIEKIYKYIIKYNNYENKFSDNLKNSNKKLCNGYFVDKIWFEEWKNYTNYDIIKKNFLQGNINKKSIIDNIIFHREKNKNKPKLSSMKLIDFTKKEELINYLKNNSLVLLDKTLISSFSQSSLNKGYKFYLYNNNIEFESNNEIFLKVSSNNNIIPLNRNIQININNNSNNNNLLNLKLLTKLYYFQKELNRKIDLPYGSIPQDNKDNNYIYLLNKKILDKYKNHFEYFKLRESLIKIDINYNNFENEYLK